MDKNKQIKKIIKTSVVGLFVGITIFITPLSSLFNQEINRDIAVLTEHSVPPQPTEKGYLHLEYRLKKLLQAYKTKGINSAQNLAKQYGISFQNGYLPVVFRGGGNSKYPSQIGAEIKSRISREGGQILSSYHNRVTARIPLSSLINLADSPTIQCIHIPIEQRPHESKSEGLSLMGVEYYHDLPAYKSDEEVKVCVLDVGFLNYQDLLGTDLPDSVITKSFRYDGNIENDEVHGTACAEIIHDVAPDARLYLANIHYTADIWNAVQWIVDQGIDIISYSLGSYWGPGDGNGFLNELAKYAKENGTTWVCSAGNEADGHWSGSFNDPDNDGWHNFNGDDEILQFHVPANYGRDYGVEAILKWNDWGSYDPQTGYSGATQDYDLYLWVWENSTWNPVDSSQSRQPNYPYPYESIEINYTEKDTYWGVGIKKNKANKSVNFDLYIPVHKKGSLEYGVPEGSLTMPADSANVITVGAVDAELGTYHYYSSRGPTKDGRLKPDISAPSLVSVSESTYGSRPKGKGFAGTSAACPHMAGAIALLKTKTPFTVDQIIKIIYGRVRDAGEPGPDFMYGRGYIKLHR